MAEAQKLSAAERERRQTQRQQAAGRVIFSETPTLDLPGMGRRQLKLRNPDLALIERRLTPLLEDLPGRLRGTYVLDDGTTVPEGTDGARWSEFVNVWDALETLGNRFPMDTINVLLHAALRHTGITQEQVDELPPSIYRDPNVERALSIAVGIAFGAGMGDDDTRPTGAGDSPAE